MVFETNLDLEEATEAENVFLLLLDYKKFFDFVIQEIVWGLATWRGMPQCIVRLLRIFYVGLTSVFKYNCHFLGNPGRGPTPSLKHAFSP